MNVKVVFQYPDGKLVAANPTFTLSKEGVDELGKVANLSKDLPGFNRDDSTVFWVMSYNSDLSSMGDCKIPAYNLWST